MYMCIFTNIIFMCIFLQSVQQERNRHKEKKEQVVQQEGINELTTAAAAQQKLSTNLLPRC